MDTSFCLYGRCWDTLTFTGNLILHFTVAYYAILMVLTAYFFSPRFLLSSSFLLSCFPAFLRVQSPHSPTRAQKQRAHTETPTNNSNAQTHKRTHKRTHKQSTPARTHSSTHALQIRGPLSPVVRALPRRSRFYSAASSVVEDHSLARREALALFR